MLFFYTVTVINIILTFLLFDLYKYASWVSVHINVTIILDIAHDVEFLQSLGSGNFIFLS